jgi:hypothetical protein
MDVGFDAADRVDVDAGSVDAFASKGVVRDGFDLGTRRGSFPSCAR